jgi:hypothetical protein
MLKTYYKAVQKWIEQDCPECQPFINGNGLCGNLHFFTTNPYKVQELRDEMTKQFVSEGLDDSYPFNDTDNPYGLEGKLRKIFKNPQRLDWIKRHAQD